MAFIYYPLAVRKNQERRSIPGAKVMIAPRGSHRHRRDDLLTVLLNLSGEHRYDGEEHAELTDMAANVFFGAQGSVTRALQEACEEVNRRILERNLDRGYEGIRAAGAINLAAVHNGWLFISQYGRMETVLISSDKYEEFGKSEGASDSLGQSKRIQTRFFQSEVKEGDLILMTGKAPPSWSSYYLAGSAAIPMDQVKRRLLNQVTADIEAVVIKCEAGGGQVESGDWSEAVEKTTVDQERAEETDTGPDGSMTTQTEKSSDEIPAELEREPLETPSARSAQEEPYEEIPGFEGAESDAIPVIPGQTERPNIAGSAYTDAGGEGKKPGPWMLKLARAWMSARTLNSKLRLGFDRMRKKLLPKSRPLQETASPVFMVVLALAVPVLLVLLSVSAYTRIGRTEQYASYMEQAQGSAELARVEKNAIQQHAYWAEALVLVKSAEKYNVTQDSRMLYEQAQFLLDDMDLAARLDFRPALTQFFPDGMVISRIQASSSGVYLLDKTSGSILRIYLNTKGFYEIDDEFKCAPGSYGLETVTDLVDFITLPANDDNYRIMAVDNTGNLLYCRPGEVPVSRTLAAPEGGWGRIAAVGYAENILYVLDADNDAIWMYAGKDPNQPDIKTTSGIVFSESPVKFLDEDVPDLGGAQDLAINQEDVYILHQDGHMTHCRYSPDENVRLTECQDPIPYTDNRVGREDKKPWIFTDAVFTMLQGTRLPNSSIYVLDTANPSLYQFSFQLNLERILRPQYSRSYPLPESPPTGFGVSPDLELFLAYDNKLYLAPLK